MVKVWGDSPEGVTGRLKWPGGRSVCTKSIGVIARADFLEAADDGFALFMTEDMQRLIME
jgi:hypothetical protein